MALTHVPDPRWLITENDTWAVMLNENQSLIGRCFFLLKRPETDVAALTDEELQSLWAMVRWTKKALDDNWMPDHFNYAFLMNLDKQVHFHIIPRYRTRREFEGGTFVDPEYGNHYGIGPARHLDNATYDAVIQTIKRKMIR